MSWNENAPASWRARAGHDDRQRLHYTPAQRQQLTRDVVTLRDLLRCRRCAALGDESSVWTWGRDPARDLPRLESEAKPAMERLLYTLVREAWR